MPDTVITRRQGRHALCTGASEKEVRSEARTVGRRRGVSPLLLVGFYIYLLFLGMWGIEQIMHTHNAS